MSLYEATFYIMMTHTTWNSKTYYQREKNLGTCVTSWLSRLPI